MTEALVHCRRRRFAVTQLLPDTLENQHIGVHAHTDCEDHSSNARQGQRCAAKTQEPEQNDQVQDQRHIGVDAGAVIVHQHEDQHREHAYDSGSNARPDRIRSQRRPHGAFF